MALSSSSCDPPQHSHNAHGQASQPPVPASFYLSHPMMPSKIRRAQTQLRAGRSSDSVPCDPADKIQAPGLDHGRPKPSPITAQPIRTCSLLSPPMCRVTLQPPPLLAEITAAGLPISVPHCHPPDCCQCSSHRGCSSPYRAIPNELAVVSPTSSLLFLATQASSCTSTFQVHFPLDRLCPCCSLHPEHPSLLHLPSLGRGQLASGAGSEWRHGLPRACTRAPACLSPAPPPDSLLSASHVRSVPFPSLPYHQEVGRGLERRT